MFRNFLISNTYYCFITQCIKKKKSAESICTQAQHRSLPVLRDSDGMVTKCKKIIITTTGRMACQEDIRRQEEKCISNNIKWSSDRDGNNWMEFQAQKLVFPAFLKKSSSYCKLAMSYVFCICVRLKLCCCSRLQHKSFFVGLRVYFIYLLWNTVWP